MRSKSLPRHGKFTGAKMLGVMFHPSLGNGTDWGQTFAPRFFDERTKGVTLSRGDAPTIEGVAHSKPRETPDASTPISRIEGVALSFSYFHKTERSTRSSIREHSRKSPVRGHVKVLFRVRPSLVFASKNEGVTPIFLLSLFASPMKQRRCDTYCPIGSRMAPGIRKDDQVGLMPK
jgi:hypothetical protein